ncbi:diguanylate cyclase [Clostridium sp. AM58-1XD]|uniref:GGDEF domain-containing protein n=1 Tax=Clostridium sp. AM58-1XD TaxID=2292307 RepID=UPI0015F5DDE9|nr:diguanylate cyclase [Clostridium sp. AM58-1XD]
MFPMTLLFLFVYLFILLEYMAFFRGRLVAFVFTSGTFLFHIMNVYMMFYGLFSLIYGSFSMNKSINSSLNASLIFIVLLVLNIFLEVFQKIVDKQVIQLLIKNISQLYFVTTSLMIINVYLFILSISYTLESVLNSVLPLFLLITSVLLFGAFYTAFNHAVRMSILAEYEIKSKTLESQLMKSNQNIDRLESFANSDPLTGAPNRRYGLQVLNYLLHEKQRFCICFIDLDHLKYVNDAFGHSEGDKYILCVIRALIQVFGEKKICRMGGDEFMILWKSNEREAEELLKRAVKQMEETAKRSGFNFKPSVSYGILEVDEENFMGASEILDIVDQRMYAQKQAKKHQRQ